MNFNNIEMRIRLWIAGAMSSIYMLLLTGTILLLTATSSQVVADVEVEFARAKALREAEGLLQQVNAPADSVLETWDAKAERRALEEASRAFAAHDQELVRRFEGDAAFATRHTEVKTLARALEQYVAAAIDQADARASALAAGDAAATQAAVARAGEAMNRADRTLSEVSKHLRDLGTLQDERVAASLGEQEQLNRYAFLAAIVLVVLGVSANGISAFLFVRGVTTPMRDAVVAFERFAKGDLRAFEVEERKDEIGRMLGAMTQMGASLRGLMTGLRANASKLSESTTHVAATASEYAASAAQQATAVAEISTTVEEIKQTSLSAASLAREVAESGEEAAAHGRDGQERLDTAVATMRTINERVTGVATQILRLAEQTSQIGVIVDSVNDLAEQSNLLAVNASIEAARAGEHGRGFSVVAAEVRSLAEQSKRATQQIRSILADIQKASQSAVMATEEGTKRAEDGRLAVEGLRDVVDTLAARLEETSVKGRQIAGAANQQASGIAQIAAAIGGVARAGQDNAVGVKQLDHAVRDLQQLAADLKRTSDAFQV